LFGFLLEIALVDADLVDPVCCGVPAGEGAEMPQCNVQGGSDAEVP
jgi:hypothetical protein